MNDMNDDELEAKREAKSDAELSENIKRMASARMIYDKATFNILAMIYNRAKTFLDPGEKAEAERMFAEMRGCYPVMYPTASQNEQRTDN